MGPEAQWESRHRRTLLDSGVCEALHRSGVMGEENATLGGSPFEDLGIRAPSKPGLEGGRDAESARPAPKTGDDLILEVLVRSDLIREELRTA